MNEEMMMEEGKKVTKLRTAFLEKAVKTATENAEEYGYGKEQIKDAINKIKYRSATKIPKIDMETLKYQKEDPIPS